METQLVQDSGSSVFLASVKIPVWLVKSGWARAPFSKGIPFMRKKDQGNAWLSVTSCGRAVAFGNPGSEGQALQKWGPSTLGRDSVLGSKSILVFFEFWREFIVGPIHSKLETQGHSNENTHWGIFTRNPFSSKVAPDPVTNGLTNGQLRWNNPTYKASFTPFKTGSGAHLIMSLPTRSCAVCKLNASRIWPESGPGGSETSSLAG